MSDPLTDLEPEFKDGWNAPAEHTQEPIPKVARVTQFLMRAVEWWFDRLFYILLRRVRLIAEGFGERTLWNEYDWASFTLLDVDLGASPIENTPEPITLNDILGARQPKTGDRIEPVYGFSRPKTTDARFELGVVVDSVDNQIQTVAFTGDVTGGTFTLTFDGQTTADIAYDAAPIDVESALVNLGNIDSGQVEVKGQAGDWEVVFLGALAESDVPLMSADGASLTGSGSVGVDGSSATGDIAFQVSAGKTTEAPDMITTVTLMHDDAAETGVQWVAGEFPDEDLALGTPLYWKVFRNKNSTNDTLLSERVALARLRTS